MLCAAESKSQLKAHITKAGVYALTDTEKKMPERDSVTGFVTEGGRVFHSATTNVALLKGSSFGFDFRIDGVPTNRPVRLTHLVTHPTMKKADGSILTKQAFDRDVIGNNGNISGTLWYTLREDYELVPGLWTLSVLDGNSVLVERTFTVTPPSSPAPKGK